jgi:hypothetical protein
MDESLMERRRVIDEVPLGRKDLLPGMKFIDGTS